ncbi:RNA polymerase sigma factor [Chitinophaga japonensis]|uniref:RNA polymerase sigma-70 factor (ECF subfamily) n=1 Tax=Chitinophaga japonensis TaxID=104662 RepID=A0A562SUJ8_CHIJA|nr:RNA polymerase sigma factor [Chitinophaga japonensis]TWI84376.1 RNA polymerase sigma-70 factor (ECF subfamily) [Chitinophaga japonensis]
MQPTSDELLVSELKAGSQWAFSEIYNRYYTRLHLEANYKLRDKEAAADAVHDVFATIWRKKGELPEQLSLKGYLSFCIRNKCIDIIRRELQFQHYASQHEAKEPVVQADPAVAKERSIELRNAIDNLPTAQRAVVQLVHSGFSHKEIMALTGKSIQTIKNLLGTAKKTLREKLVPHHI